MKSQTQQQHQDELAEAAIDLLERAGASETFIEFVRRFPETNASRQVQSWLESGLLADDNAEAGKPHSGGFFFDELWAGNVEVAYGSADLANKRRLDEVL
ncbi:hypothetical protein [Natronorubrum sulfidifaciens]|uniref:Uncharacterized protein n=1 Tax=Natronorubrum sulfidifaciens JCM 14089 TaxID=1230460 RepID=L9WCV6_9EURY|nr:hypothetical protein [Natronorubrum sulfidifaciens]ELY47330.1 hypothetical protein C495_03692 [Natronorubrum sulfidifaciens JCM 14089]